MTDADPTSIPPADATADPAPIEGDLSAEALAASADAMATPPDATPQPPAIPPAEVPEGFFDDATWMPRRIDPVRGALELVKAHEQTEITSRVLNDKIEGETKIVHILGLIQTAIKAGFQGKPVGVLATTPGCPALGSLLAPGIDDDVPGLVAALGAVAPAQARLSPQVIEAMVAVRRAMSARQTNQNAARQWMAITQMLVALLARTNGSDARSVIVPGTSLTVFAMDALAVMPGSQAVFVYEPLEQAVARMMSSRARRNAALGAAAKMVPDLRLNGLLGNANLGALPEHQRVALAWVSEMWVAHATATRVKDRTRTVAWNTVLDDPTKALGAIAGFMGLSFDNEQADTAAAMVAALDDREAVHAFAAENKPMLDDAAHFLREVQKRRPMPNVVPAPLLG